MQYAASAGTAANDLSRAFSVGLSKSIAYTMSSPSATTGGGLVGGLPVSYHLSLCEYHTGVVICTSVQMYLFWD